MALVHEKKKAFSDKPGLEATTMTGKEAVISAFALAGTTVGGCC